MLSKCCMYRFGDTACTLNKPYVASDENNRRICASVLRCLLRKGAFSTVCGQIRSEPGPYVTVIGIVGSMDEGDCSDANIVFSLFSVFYSFVNFDVK